jgi:hypothetical protein
MQALRESPDKKDSKEGAMLKRISVLVAAAAMCVGTSAIAQSHSTKTVVKHGATTIDQSAVQENGASSTEAGQTASSRLDGGLIAPVSIEALVIGAGGGTCTKQQAYPCCQNTQGASPYNGKKCCPGYPVNCSSKQ